MLRGDHPDILSSGQQLITSENLGRNSIGLREEPENFISLFFLKSS